MYRKKNWYYNIHFLTGYNIKSESLGQMVIDISHILGFGHNGFLVAY